MLMKMTSIWKRTLFLVALSVMTYMITSTQARLTKRGYRRLQSHFKRDLGGRQNLLPSFIMMSFHDCIGGCDGCVDTNVQDNKNLEPAVRFANDFRRRRAPNLSQADINAFVGTQALEITARNANGRMNMPFYIGRRDCRSSHGFPVRKIAPGHTTDSIGFLKRNFRVSTTEAVALMGCHSLGRTRSHISGFDGPWTFTEFALDSAFYENLRNPGFTVERRNVDVVKSSQWSKHSNGGKTMMLHADMVLFKRYTTSGIFDEPSCSYNTCPAASTANLVHQFANSQRTFHRTLKRAFVKMVSNGYRRLNRVV